MRLSSAKIGMRVTMTAEARKIFDVDENSRSGVILSKTYTNLLRIKRDNRKGSTSYHPSFWKSEPKKTQSQALGDSMSDRKLSSEQLENWRKVLAGMYGSLAKAFTDDDVHEYRDLLEKIANSPNPEGEDNLVDFVQRKLSQKDPEVISKLIKELSDIEDQGKRSNEDK